MSIPMSSEFRPISNDEARAFYGGVLYPGVTDITGAFLDGKLVGVSGVLVDPSHFGTMFEESARKIGFLDATEDAKKLGYRAMLAIRAKMKTMDDTVFVQCDSVNYPDAPKLLKALGFVETDEMEKDARNNVTTLRVWKWRR